MPLLGARATASRGYFGGGTTPDAPTSLVATRGNTQLSVAFSAPAFNGGLEITTYEYALSTNSYATWTTRATGTTASPLVITGLSNGTSYQVKLRAVNTLGAGAVSAASAAVTPATVPGTPTSPSISSGNGSISVSWVAPSDGGNPPLTYTVETQKNSEAYVNRGLQTSPYPLSGTGINNGATYRAKITANNTVGSSATAAVTGDTVPSAVPDAPAKPTAMIGNGQVVLAWVAPADNSSTISDYDIEQTTDDGASWTDSAYASAVVGTTVASLTNGTTYKFRVRATNGRGIGAWSVASDGYKPGTVPSTPSAPTLTGGDRSLTATFTAPADNGYTISGYEINYTYNDGTNWSGWSAAVSPQVNAAFNGLTWKAKIRATNAIGTSGESALSNAITPAMTLPTVSWSDSSATKYSNWSGTWSGTADYTYQPQQYLSSWLDSGTTRSGAGTHTSDTMTVGYTGTTYTRVKVTDPDGLVNYTNQIYVTNGRPGDTVIDRAANTVVDVAGYYTTSAAKTSSGFVLFDSTHNGGYGGTAGTTSPYPLALSGTTVGLTGFRILMQKYDSGTYDLTSGTRRVYVYGPAGIAMALYSGATAGQTWGDGVASSTRWTGTADVGYTWNVNSAVSGSGYDGTVGGYIVWNPSDMFLQAYSAANPTTQYSTFWGATVRTKVSIYVYYRTRAYTATTYLPQTYYSQVNSVYG